jgi:hypothetical protein
MDQNVVARLKQRIDEARRMGFRVRMEPLDGEEATWCEIAGVPTLFVDLAQTAAEQLRQLDEALANYGRIKHAQNDTRERPVANPVDRAA